MRTLFSRKTAAAGDDQLEMRSHVASLAEIEWLLLLLVILYSLAPGTVMLQPGAMVVSMVAFAVFVIGFNYFHARNNNHRWKLVISTWVMIAFITWVIWNTGGVQSPLSNLYLLVIIISAMTLGKLATLLEIILIGIAYFFVALRQSNDFPLTEFSRLIILFAPFILVAWVTALLANDIQAGSTLFKSLANTDEMTGLLNKRSLKLELERAMQLTLQNKQTLTVMMFDADNLKQTNDTHGHAAGDRLIMHIATILRSSFRSSDIVCRYGGDEFVAVLPQMGLAKAVEISERIRKAVAQTGFGGEGNLLTTSVSVGFATWPDHMGHAKDITQLMVLADASLYESKRKGRNQVAHAGELQNIRHNTV